jgi:hypothetical protein
MDGMTAEQGRRWMPFSPKIIGNAVLLTIRVSTAAVAGSARTDAKPIALVARGQSQCPQRAPSSDDDIHGRCLLLVSPGSSGPSNLLNEIDARIPAPK